MPVSFSFSLSPLLPPLFYSPSSPVAPRAISRRPRPGAAGTAPVALRGAGPRARGASAAAILLVGVGRRQRRRRRERESSRGRRAFYSCCCPAVARASSASCMALELGVPVFFTVVGWLRVRKEKENEGIDQKLVKKTLLSFQANSLVELGHLLARCWWCG